jgi:hypothetical protein
LLAKRFGVLWRYKKRLAELDALIVPDKTTLMLKKWLGNDCPVLINTFHGAGDRSGGYRGVAGFDYHLLPGRKYKERMLAEKLVSDDRCSIVGYVKFDQFRDAPRPKLFDNDRKTILYAPHFDPRFSSWFGWGEKLLKLFANNEKYNFIFAPHVLLFRRRWHISTEGGLPHITPKIPDFAYEADNFIVDPGSISSINMTYTRAADIYLGDVSSLVYEFQLDKRPCFFLNKSQVDWRNNENFRFWTTGKVIESFDELGSAVDNADIDFEEYREEQERAFSESFDLNETLSAVRAADAIIRFLAMEKLLPDNISPEAR